MAFGIQARNAVGQITKTGFERTQQESNDSDAARRLEDIRQMVRESSLPTRRAQSLTEQYPQLQVEEVHGLYTIFDTFGPQDHGTEARELTLEDVETSLKKFPIFEQFSDIQHELFYEIDENADGHVTFVEFMDCIHAHLGTSLQAGSRRNLLARAEMTSAMRDDDHGGSSARHGSPSSHARPARRGEEVLEQVFHNLREEIKAVYGMVDRTPNGMFGERELRRRERIIRQRCCFFSPNHETSTRLTNESNESEHEEWWCQKCGSDFRMVWDLAQVFILVFVGIWTPYFECFQLVVEAGTPEFWLDVLLDFYFIVDIFINFRTAYISDGNEYSGAGDEKRRYAQGELVIDHWPIAKHYLRGWFCIDFVSSLPISWLSWVLDPNKSIDDTAGGRDLQVLKVLRLFKLSKLLRLTKLLRLLQRMQHDFPNMMQVRGFKLTMMTVMIFYLAHIFACLWYWVGTGYSEYDGARYDGWALQNGWDTTSSVNVTVWPRYLDALYFSVTTLTTVGYGDRTPTSNPEKIYAIIVEIVGGMLFAFASGTMSAMMVEQSAAEANIKQEMNNLREFLNSKEVFPKLSNSICVQMEHFYKENAFEQEKIMQNLPPNLKKKLLAHMYKSKIDVCPLFNDVTDREHVIAAVCSAMKPFIAMRHDELIQEGCVAESMFMVEKGKITITSTRVTALNNKVWVDGAFFGELHMLHLGDGPRADYAWYTATALQETALCYISKEAYTKILASFPNLRHELRVLAKKRAVRFSIPIKDGWEPDVKKTAASKDIQEQAAKRMQELIGVLQEEQAWIISQQAGSNAPTDPKKLAEIHEESMERLEMLMGTLQVEERWLNDSGSAVALIPPALSVASPPRGERARTRSATEVHKSAQRHLDSWTE